MIGIYKITSPTGRIYIGQSKNLEERLRYYSVKSSKCQVKLHRSFKKHGIKSHKFEIIEECSQEMLNDKERYWQEYYNVLKEGLNCQLTTSENAPREMSEEYKKAISNTLKTKYQLGEIVNPRLGKGHILNIYDIHGNILKKEIFTEDAVNYLGLANRSVINSRLRTEGICIVRQQFIVLFSDKSIFYSLKSLIDLRGTRAIPVYQVFKDHTYKRCTASSKIRVINKILNSKNLMYYSKKNNSYYTFIGLLKDLPL